MARTCTVCVHKDRDSIDDDLVRGVAYRDLTKRYGVSISALSRHRADHVSTALAKLQGDERRRAGALLDRLEDLEDRARRILDAAESEGRPGVSLQAIRELRSILELAARITGVLDERSQQVVNVLVAPEWLALRGAIFDALAEHPEARIAVAERLGILEGPKIVETVR